MIWSWSTSRMFQKCQRQWYFKTQVANHKASDEFRREAYLLSKLQSVSAWRGSLVDHVISTEVIPAIKNHKSVILSAIIQKAHDLFEKNWQAATANSLRNPGFSKTQAGQDFAALHSIEYGIEISVEERQRAWTEIEQSLTNLSKMSSLLDKLRSAQYLCPQRPLIYSLSGISVRAVPDLIAFFDDEPPLIVDWKVNFFGTNDYRQQLGTYALALFRCDPHRDFPPIQKFAITETQLLEVQLITNLQRSYKLTDEDILEIESYVYSSAQQMLLALGNEEDTLQPFEYPVTNDPTLCERCNFRSLCWKEKESWAKWKQTSLL